MLSQAFAVGQCLSAIRGASLGSWCGSLFGLPGHGIGVDSSPVWQCLVSVQSQLCLFPVTSDQSSAGNCNLGGNSLCNVPFWFCKVLAPVEARPSHLSQCDNAATQLSSEAFRLFNRSAELLSSSMSAA